MKKEALKKEAIEILEAELCKDIRFVRFEDDEGQPSALFEVLCPHYGEMVYEWRFTYHTIPGQVSGDWDHVRPRSSSRLTHQWSTSKGGE